MTVFADLERFPKRQVFQLQQLPDDLVGCQYAVDFDFLSFRTSIRQQLRSPNAAILT
ncbi:MAG: hypothetical protein WCJ35_26085 [Planctomycetota bacterium]